MEKEKQKYYQYGFKYDKEKRYVKLFFTKSNVAYNYMF